MLMQRRQFLVLSASSLGAVLLSRCANFGTQVQSSAQPLGSKQYTSRDGLLALDLDARDGTVVVAGQQARLLSYGGRIPGPRLEARPGDTVRINFTNRLSAPTNLHYHGLHISPIEQADNVFLEIPAGEQFTYEFKIPTDHPGILGYYHPHQHGYVAQQIFGGLGGIFVVRGPLDEIPEVQAAQEEFLFLKDFEPDATVNATEPYQGVKMLGREGSLVTVNGQLNPTLSIPAGGLLRLRLVNASTARFYRLTLEEHPFYLIATDGGAIAQPIELAELLLSPGERAEVLVQANREPGQYRLLNLPYDRVRMGMGGGMMGRGMMGGQQNSQMPQPLATLTYSEQVTPLPLPQQLLPVETLPAPQTVRQFTLNHSMAPGRGMVFLINGEAFDGTQADTVVKLGSVEDWEIINTGMMDHPFHLHTNPFQVLDRNGQPSPYRAWKDTVLVPVGESVRLRVRFADFAGKTVYHCHILDHEDLGMMGTIEMQA